MKQKLSTSKLSNLLEDGKFLGTIETCKVDRENGRVAIVINNEDGTVGRASWKVWKDSGEINQDGGADAFNTFAVGVLDLDDDISEEDIDEICEQMQGKSIEYANKKHFSTKTQKNYNRFTFIGSRDGTGEGETEEEAETDARADLEIDVVDYALKKIVYKYPIKKVNGTFVVPVEGVDLINRVCDKKGVIDEEDESNWALAPSGKGVFDWEFNLTLFEAWFKYTWRYRYLNKKGWRAWVKEEA